MNQFIITGTGTAALAAASQAAVIPADIPTLSISLMAVSALISIGLPIFLLVFFRKKYRMPLLPALLGAVAFVVAVLILEALVHRFVFKTIPIAEHVVPYVIYGCLMAGIFEESARLLVFVLMRKKPRDTGTALSYGIGHGGIEAILLAGSAMLSNIIISVFANKLGVGAVASFIPGADEGVMNAAVATLAGTAPGMFLVGGIERIFAIGVQISLSVLVFYAVFGARKRWLYPAAILLHALVDLPAMLFQLGIIKSIAVVEAATCACCIVLILLARIVHKRFASGSALITGQGDAAQANPEEQQ